MVSGLISAKAAPGRIVDLLRTSRITLTLPFFLRSSWFRNGWCPAQNLACERMKRAVAEYGGRIDYRVRL
jgi:hypothetical protein